MPTVIDAVEWTEDLKMAALAAEMLIKSGKDKERKKKKNDFKIKTNFKNT